MRFKHRRHPECVDGEIFIVVAAPLPVSELAAAMLGSNFRL
jgi:hypothetical protein